MMFRVITVKIEHRRDILHFKTQETDLKPNDSVIIKSLLGEEIGRVAKSFGNVFNEIKNICDIPEMLRKATDKDLENFERKSGDEQKANEFCLKKIFEREIPIKLIKVSFFTSERKAIFYFSSRDEAKMIGGLGICGRQICCKTFLNNIEPITLQMAKRQNLNMNPIKISGQCGRLMCCLSYEEDHGGRIFIEDQHELVGYNEVEDIDEQAEMAEKLKEVTDKEDEGLSAKK